MRRVRFLLLSLTVVLLALSLPPLERRSPAFAHLETTPARNDVPGYERQAFGGWARTGTCTTRDVLLATQLFDVPTSASCTVEQGWGRDPYSGRRIGVGDPSAEPIEIDHVFPLAAAWDLGAHAWSREQRENFANDPLNLVVVSKQQNQEKSDALPATWLPAKRSQRCWYVNRLAEVAVAYALALPEADVAVMRRQCLLR